MNINIKISSVWCGQVCIMNIPAWFLSTDILVDTDISVCAETGQLQRLGQYISLYFVVSSNLVIFHIKCKFANFFKFIKSYIFLFHIVMDK